MIRLRHLVGAALIATTAIGAAGCGGGKLDSTDPAHSTFHDQGNRSLSCLAHQSQLPMSIDVPGKHEDPEAVLDFLHYYTVNGNRPYCDGKHANVIDRRWLALYLAAGSAKANIKRASS